MDKMYWKHFLHKYAHRYHCLWSEMGEREKIETRERWSVKLLISFTVQVQKERERLWQNNCCVFVMIDD